MLADLEIEETFDALIVSIGEDGSQLIQSIGAWLSNFMANLQMVLQGMDQDSLVEMTGKVPDFIIEASDDSAGDLCREESDVESENDDEIAMSPCSLAQMFASKLKGSGSEEVYDPTPNFKSMDGAMTISEIRYVVLLSELQLSEFLLDVPFSASFENAIRSIHRRLSSNFLSELAVLDQTSTLDFFEQIAITVVAAEKTAKTSCTRANAYEQKTLTCCLSKFILSFSRDAPAIMSLIESSGSVGRTNQKSKFTGQKLLSGITAILKAKLSKSEEGNIEGRQFGAGSGPDMNGDGQITVVELKMFLNTMEYMEHAYENELDELSESVKLYGTLRVSIKAFYANVKTALASMDGRDVLFDMKTLNPSESWKEIREELWTNTVNDLCGQTWTHGLEFTPCCFAKLLALIGREVERLSDLGFFSDFDFEGRTKAQVHKNNAKAIAEFFTALSQKLEPAAVRPKSRTIPEKLSSAADNFLVELYRAKKNAVSWVARKAVGLFGGSAEEEEEPAFCQISMRDNRCLSLASGRVGEFMFCIRYIMTGNGSGLSVAISCTTETCKDDEMGSASTCTDELIYSALQALHDSEGRKSIRLLRLLAAMSQ